MQRAPKHGGSTNIAALRRARTCYDHLAGQFGVAVFDHLVEQRALIWSDDGSCALGPEAPEVFGRLGVDLPGLLVRPASARPLLRGCLDWTERRYHLAGALGAALLARAEAAHWVLRRPGGRAIDVTPAGQQALRPSRRSIRQPP